MSSSWLIAGLGNPGHEYESTPHNLGFLVVDRLGVRNSIRVDRKDSKALIGLGTIAGQPVILAKPQTFMNLSGTAIQPLVEKHEIHLSRFVAVYDELDLPWTGLRVRPKGSAAGNHGMESLIRHLGTTEFPRVRVGIHPGHPVRNGAQFVLARFQRAQLQDLEEMLDHAAAAVESIIAEGVALSMTKYNRRARGLPNEER